MKTTLKADYQLGGDVGDNISLWQPEKFATTDIRTETVRVYGHKKIRPYIGQTLVGEFKHSYIKFVFVSVEYEFDPRDMFWADMKAIAQEMKVPEGQP